MSFARQFIRIQRERLHAIGRRIVRGSRPQTPEQRLALVIGSKANITTQTLASERLLLFEEISKVVQIGRLLEVGSYHGASSVVMAEALRRKGPASPSKLYCVDTWMNDSMSEGKQDTRATFLRSIEPWSDLIELVVGNSTNVTLPFEGECDAVFIDGDHSYDGCRKDAERFGKLVRQGGRLLLHDHAYYAGVTKVVGELLSAGEWYVAASADNIISLAHDKFWSSRVPKNS